MKKTSVLAICALAALSIVSVQAQTYQWKNAQGQTVISDTPPPGSAKNSRALGVNQAVQRGEKGEDKAADPKEKPAIALPQTFAEKDADFKKRQAEAKEKAEKAIKEQAAAKEKQENCERARRNLTALEGNQPMATLDDKGQRQLMNQSQREQELERARRFITESCN